MGEEFMENLEVSPQIPKENIGWLEIGLPKSVMERLQSYIEAAKENPTTYNYSLVGNISKSLVLKDKDDWFYQTVLNQLLSNFIEAFPKYMSSTVGIGNILTEDAPFCLSNFWVNFQNENEFNPSHNHSGIFSFVIWVKIPTDWEKQHALPFSANSSDPKASDFEFQYTTMLGQFKHYSYLLNKKSEGQMLLFPAKLMHTVYPFYNCDKERISISGNIKLDTSEDAMKKYREEK
jgi:hypothetical protein